MKAEPTRFVLTRRTTLLAGVCVASTLTLGPTARAQPAGVSSVDSATKNGTLRVGWAVFFPYVYKDPKNQELTGITVDLFNEMGRELGVKVAFVEDSWATMIAGLQANKFDLCSPLAHTPARAQVVDFSIPMIRSDMGMAVLKKDIAKYGKWQDLDKAGLRISTTLGSSIQTALTPQIKNAELVLVKSGAESVAQVLAGRADAWANHVDGMRHMQKEQPDLAIVPGPAYAFDSMSIVFRKGDQKTEQWLNQFIAKIRDDGTLARIITKHGLDASSVAKK